MKLQDNLNSLSKEENARIENKVKELFAIKEYIDSLSKFRNKPVLVKETFPDRFKENKLINISSVNRKKFLKLCQIKKEVELSTFFNAFYDSVIESSQVIEDNKPWMDLKFVKQVYDSFYEDFSLFNKIMLQNKLDK